MDKFSLGHTGGQNGSPDLSQCSIQLSVINSCLLTEVHIPDY